MKTHLFVKRAVLLSSAALLASSLFVLSAHAEEGQVHGAMIFAPAEQLRVPASGAVEDTLKDCLARIPEDATAGQRMLAKQNCNGEEGTRRLIQAAPEF